MDTSEAIKFLRADGRRITEERKLLLRIIEKTPHLGASDIYELAREENPKISLSTVYRTVNLLENLGLVEANPLGENRDHYEVRLQEHYHLVCLDCGKVMDIPASESIRQLARDYNFEIAGVKLEIYGYCKDCQNKRPSRRVGKHAKPTRIVDLRGVPLLRHPGVVENELNKSKAKDLLEIITDDPRRLQMAPKMLENIEGIEILDIWKEGRICHALVKKL
jgi:Fe2+ or Zn2+ uptake regulation protein/TusA-related sulfurtransferase